MHAFGVDDDPIPPVSFVTPDLVPSEGHFKQAMLYQSCRAPKAWGLKKHIVAITDKITPEEIPEITRSHKTLDLNDFEKYVEELIQRARKVS